MIYVFFHIFDYNGIISTIIIIIHLSYIILPEINASKNFPLYGFLNTMIDLFNSFSKKCTGAFFVVINTILMSSIFLNNNINRLKRKKLDKYLYKYVNDLIKNCFISRTSYNLDYPAYLSLNKYFYQ